MLLSRCVHGGIESILIKWVYIPDHQLRKPSIITEGEEQTKQTLQITTEMAIKTGSEKPASN